MGRWLRSAIGKAEFAIQRVEIFFAELRHLARQISIHSPNILHLGCIAHEFRMRAQPCLGCLRQRIDMSLDARLMHRLPLLYLGRGALQLLGPARRLELACDDYIVIRWCRRRCKRR